MPEMRARYGDRGRQHCIDDTVYHLTYLGEAVELGDATLFADYIGWAKIMLGSRGVGGADLAANLEQIRDVLRANPSDGSAEAIVVLDHVIELVPSMPEIAESFIVEKGPIGETARSFLEEMLKGRGREADAVIRAALDRGASVKELYLQVFEPVQHEVGRLWQMAKVSVAQEHYCTAAVQRAMSQLYPLLFTGVGGRRRLVAACAGGELHEIGLRMVADLFEASGWDSVYLGSNVPIESVVRMVGETPTALVAISTTITPNLSALTALIRALRENPATRDVPIMVGGYPFRVSADVASRVGADGWAASASEAVRRGNELGLAA